MLKLWCKLQSRRDEGASAVEYAMIVALIAVFITAGVGIFGGKLNDFFKALSGKIGV
ncbi:Flp family type IVb pilin [Micromonospora sp. NPDC048930]|uniref:Flp family type IVb pilin n=1 Tax=Micromonospora sp. NPDC048930 TaxID=3364261 RepID=UPI0037107C25